MSFSPRVPRRSRTLRTSAGPIALGVIVFAAAGCATSSVTPTTSVGPTASLSQMPPPPDPRVGLSPGLFDAAEAMWNLRVLSETKPSEKFLGGINSDLAFSGNYVFQGSFSGYQVWDISNPGTPKLRTTIVCPGGQGDPSVLGNLLFMSVEEKRGRVDCGSAEITDSVSTDRFRGVRIF